MTTRTAPTPLPADRQGGRGWLVPVALVLLSVIPLVSGTLRVIEIAGGPALMPDNPRTETVPAPVVVHVLGAFLYAVLGAFQFSARFRNRHRAWHRRTGRVLIVAGLAVAGSGLWMTVFSTGAPGGDLLWAVRLVVSSAMGAAIVLAFAAVRRRDFGPHRAWMIRAYALALGAGTQVVTQGVGEGFFGRSDLSTALSVSAGWVLNAAVAEWVIRRGARKERRGHPRTVLVPTG